MRVAFVETLADIADRDERIVLLTGDLGYLIVETFSDRHPERFFNVGVAEQNLLGVSTGLAEAGFLPFAYSIAAFAALRPYEFIRNGPVAHALPVRIVGVGGGLDYGHNGLSHFAIEDLALMRAQPGLTVIAPADSPQTQEALLACWDLERPIYFRLGKDALSIAELQGRFRLGRAELVGDGEDLAIVAVGPLVREALDARGELARQGLDATVVVVSSLNPAPEEDLAEILANVPLALTVEAHYLQGGIGSLVAEVIAERQLPCRLVRSGIAWTPRGPVGSPEYLLDLHGLSFRRIADTAIAALERAR